MDFPDFVIKAMPTLLANEDTKRLILDYLRAIIENERRDTDWREVWHFQSQEIRLLDQLDPVTAIHGIRTQLFIVGKYHATQGVGLIHAFMDAPHQWGRDDHSYDRWHLIYQTDTTILRESFTADDYTDVILQTQQRWNEAVEAWLKQTIVLRDDQSAG